MNGVMKKGYLRSIYLVALGGVAALAVLAAIQFAAQKSENRKTQEPVARTNTVNEVFQLQPRFQAGRDPGNRMEGEAIFKSAVQNPGMRFSALGIQWTEEVPPETWIQMFVRTREMKEGWSQWQPVRINNDEKYEYGHNDKRKSSFLPVPLSDRYQYKVELSGNGVVTPRLYDLKVTVIHNDVQPEFPASSEVFLASNSPWTAQLAAIDQSDISGERVKIISRAEWGANEEYRLLKSDLPEPDLVPIEAEYLEKFSDELTIVKKIETNALGQKYTWPQEYPEKVSKIIIHHTATTKDLDNPKLAIRNIYYWHTFGRGWGDIGYNYIIDTSGNIYEGRAGGEGVVGAHAGKSNVGSIGIAILGNYDEGNVPEKALISLMQLIGEKASIHGINPEGKSLFRGKVTNNILGHRDVMATTCPGENFYEKLGIVRNFSAIEPLTTIEKRGFKRQKSQGFDYQDESKQYYIEINPEERKTVTLKIKNIGSETWNNKTTLVVNRYKDVADHIGVLNASGKIPMVKSKEVKPGETATFKLKLMGGLKPSYKVLELTPLVNGTKKLEKYIQLPINANAPILSYDFVDAQWPKQYMRQGERFTGWVELRNTGNVSWDNHQRLNIRLGADRPRDRISPFLVPADTRIAFLEQGRVDPGQTGKFIFEIQAPHKNGKYIEFMTPVVEGVSWLADSGMHFETYVYSKKYNAELVGTNAPLFVTSDKKTQGWITVKNTGGVVWQRDGKDGVILEQQGGKDVEVTSLKMLEKSVKPGETATFTFDVEAPRTRSTHRVRFRLKRGKRPLMAKTIRFPVKVKKRIQLNKPKEIPQQNISSDGRVRVLIDAFAGSPEITASGVFYVEVGKNIGWEFKPGETVKVRYEGGKYFIESVNYSGVSDDPVRIRGIQDSILQIKNYEMRPEWNLSLNDNEFRDTLEVHFVDGALRVINELSIEDYLKGLAEVPGSEPYEKAKAIIVAARTYATYYSTIGQKFPGKPYHLDDNPEHTQKYRGYGLEKRGPRNVKAVEETSGLVITYNGAVVLTPYFSQSSGRTIDPKILWGWDNTPYLKSVDDPHCEGLEQRGHGVGMSGCGARGMAEEGKTFDDILHYYYDGIVLKKLSYE